jgi:hypothetical protein
MVVVTVACVKMPNGWYAAAHAERHLISAEFVSNILHTLVKRTGRAQAVPVHTVKALGGH